MAKFIIALVVCSFLAAASALPKHRKILPDRVDGGEDAKEGDFPYQVSLRYGEHDDIGCGGSIVVVKGTHIVVTAAFCVVDDDVDSFSVVAGDLIRSDNSGLEQIRRVSRIVIHEDYNASYYNDIALLFITSPFDFNENVGPIALPTQEQQTSGDIVVSGWGTFSGKITDILQYVQIPVVSDTVCQTAYDWEIIPSILCAGLDEGEKGSCTGDFGGPLRAVNGNYLAGIYSWGYGCVFGFTDIHTEVSYFVDWINNQVQ